MLRPSDLRSQGETKSMPTSTKLQLQFGLSGAIPETAKAAWGARLIFPDDLLHDRQSFANMDSPDGQRLKSWLNTDGALKSALDAARKMAKNYQLEPSEHRQVTLFEDATGTIVGNPNSSYGYLYVAAWLKEAA